MANFKKTKGSFKVSNWKFVRKFISENFPYAYISCIAVDSTGIGNFENLGCIVHFSKDRSKENKINLSRKLCSFKLGLSTKEFFRQVFDEKKLDVRNKIISFSYTFGPILGNSMYGEVKENSILLCFYGRVYGNSGSWLKNEVHKLELPYTSLYELRKEFIEGQEINVGTSHMSWIVLKIPFSQILDIKKEGHRFKVFTVLNPTKVILHYIFKIPSHIYRATNRVSEIKKLEVPEDIISAFFYAELEELEPLTSGLVLEYPFYFRREGKLVERIIDRRISKIDDRDFSQLEKYVYFLLSKLERCIWIGKDEDVFREIFREEGMKNSCDLILSNDTQTVLIECTSKLLSKKGDHFSTKLNKLVNLKGEFEREYETYAVLICGEGIKDIAPTLVKEALDKASKENIKILFQDHLRKLEAGEINTFEEFLSFIKPTF